MTVFFLNKTLNLFLFFQENREVVEPGDDGMSNVQLFCAILQHCFFG